MCSIWTVSRHRWVQFHQERKGPLKFQTNQALPVTNQTRERQLHPLRQQTRSGWSMWTRVVMVAADLPQFIKLDQQVEERKEERKRQRNRFVIHSVVGKSVFSLGPHAFNTHNYYFFDMVTKMIDIHVVISSTPTCYALHFSWGEPCKWCTCTCTCRTYTTCCL